MSTSLTDENPKSVPPNCLRLVQEQEIKNGVGKVSQSLARKISHVWRDYSRGK